MWKPPPSYASVSGDDHSPRADLCALSPSGASLCPSTGSGRRIEAPETSASPNPNVPLWLTPTLLGRRAAGLIRERWQLSGRP
jgi:hypothetical protein